MKLQDRVAIVTGAASGIGRATTMALADQGADIAMFDINEVKLAGVADEVKLKGRSALALHCDVSNAQGVDAAVKRAADTLGRIDILINDVEIIYAGTVAEMR